MTSLYLEYHEDENGDLHRVDGPAVVRSDGTIAYFVNHTVPRAILDLIILRYTDGDFDYEMFPSAVFVPEVHYIGGCHHAYRITDPDELVLAILRYS